MVAQPSLTNWLHLITLGVIWGATFMVISIALQGYGPITVACARTTLGALTLLAVMRLLRTPWPARQTWRYVILGGLFSTAFPFMLLSWGLQYIPSAFAGIAMTFVPLFVLPMAHLFTDEKLTPRRTVGVVIGFVGALVLIGPEALSVDGGITLLAQLSCLGAAMCYGISAVQTRNCPPIDPLAMAAFTLVVGAVALIPIMLVVEGVPSWHGPAPSIAIIVLGVLPTALAAALRVMIVRSAGSVFMTLVNYQVPLWSVFFGAVILSEPLPGSLFIAMALIFAGLFTSQAGALRRQFLNR